MVNSEGVNSYRPTSFLSKIVESIVASRFVNTPRVMLFPMKQSAHRQGHSTETAVIRVLNDVIIHATDEGKVTALVLLDLSSAFDTVDHTTLLNVLE